jgi:hypothetical protein
MIDSFSKKLWAWECPTKESKYVVRYLRRVAEDVGFTPDIVRADNGGEFIAADVKHLIEVEWKKKLKHGAPAHPQTQGVIERPNRTIKNGIDYQRRRNNSNNVKFNLDITRELYNDRMHSTIKMKPNEAFEKTKYMNPSCTEAATEETFLLAASTRDVLYQNAEKRAKLNKRNHDKRKDPKTMLQPGDIVYHVKSLRDGVRRIRGPDLDNRSYEAVVVERTANHRIRVKWTTPAGGPKKAPQGSLSVFLPVGHFCKDRGAPVEDAEEETEENPADSEDPVSVVDGFANEDAETNLSEFVETIDDVDMTLDELKRVNENLEQLHKEADKILEGYTGFRPADVAEQAKEAEIEQEEEKQQDEPKTADKGTPVRSRAKVRRLLDVQGGRKRLRVK